MKTHTKSTKATSARDILRNWHLVDVAGRVLGRETTAIARLLLGKHKPSFAPNLDAGDYVVVVNAGRVVLTGKKKQQKVYTSYSGYPGGQKEITASDLLKKKPGKVVEHAVSGMLPKNKLRSRRMRRLFVFEGAEHPYADKVKITNS